SLWGKNVRFENVSQAGVIISEEKSAFTQIGFENAAAQGTPVFARFRDSGKIVAGAGPYYRVSAFNYGLMIPGLGHTGAMGMNVQMRPLAAMPAVGAPAIRRLPPVSEWTNVRDLGVKADGHTDDSASLQRAIDTHRTLYF